MRTLTETIGLVKVTLTSANPDSENAVWTVRTTWMNPDGSIMTTGSKTFTGGMADVYAAAFGNEILFEEWKRKPNQHLPRPVFAL